MGIYTVPNQNAIQKQLDATLSSGATTMTLNESIESLLPNISANSPVSIVIDRIDANGVVITNGTREFITATGVSGAVLSGLTRNADGSSTDQEHAIGAIVEFIPDVLFAESIRATVETLDSYAKQTAVSLYVTDATSSLSTGDGKIYFTIPSQLNGLVISAVHARVITAGTTGTTDIQIANVTNAVDVLSTKLTIDSGETGSDTAVTPYVINTSNDNVATNDLIRVDIDAVSTTAPKGLIVRIEFN